MYLMPGSRDTDVALRSPMYMGPLPYTPSDWYTSLDAMRNRARGWYLMRNIMSRNCSK